MKLLNSDIREYQKLYKKHFGEDLPESEAREQLTRLVRQMEIIYRPITYAQFDEYLKKYVDENQGNE